MRIGTSKLVTVVAALALGIVVSATLAQTYPSRAPRLIVGASAGGTADTVARLVAQKLGERLGQSVLVENRPGGDTIIGAEAVAKAAPDGYTLLFATGSTFTLLPHTRKSLPFDPVKSFAHVAQIAYVQFVLSVNPSVPAANVAELIALARGKPGQLSYAAASETGRLTAEMFKIATGTDIVHVPYKGAAAATTDLLAGHVNMMFTATPGVVPHINANRLKALAVSGDHRSPALPDVPTLAESGVKGFESSTAWGISAPAGTPRAIVMRVSQEVGRVLEMPDIAEKLLAQGAEPRPGSPEQFIAVLKAESEKHREVVRRIGLKPE